MADGSVAAEPNLAGNILTLAYLQKKKGGKHWVVEQFPVLGQQNIHEHHWTFMNKATYFSIIVLTVDSL